MRFTRLASAFALVAAVTAVCIPFLDTPGFVLQLSATTIQFLRSMFHLHLTTDGQPR